MADQNDGAAMVEISLALIVDLGDERAGGIEDDKLARRGIIFDGA